MYNRYVSQHVSKWICIFCFPVFAFGQADTSAKELRYSLGFENAPLLYSPYQENPKRNTIQKTPRNLLLAKNVHMPIFCRMEHEVAKLSPIQVKARLGTVEYADKLEGK